MPVNIHPSEFASGNENDRPNAGHVPNIARKSPIFGHF